MKNKLWIFAALVGLFGLGLGSPLLLQRLTSQVTPTSQAFYMETTETATNITRHHSMGKRKYVAVRRDGSKATGTIQSDFTPNGSELRDVILIPERKRVVIDESTQTMSTFYLSQVQVNRETSAARVSTNGCAIGSYFSKERPLGKTPLLSVSAYRFDDPQPSSDFTAYRGEQWYSPELDCYMVRQMSEFHRSSDNTQHRFDRVGTLITLGEPPATLFTIPPSYREVRPSEQLRQNIAVLGRQPTKSDEAFWARIDADYVRSQQFKR